MVVHGVNNDRNVGGHVACTMACVFACLLVCLVGFARLSRRYVTDCGYLDRRSSPGPSSKKNRSSVLYRQELEAGKRPAVKLVAVQSHS